MRRTDRPLVATMPVQLDDIVTLWMSGVLVIVAATIAPPVGLTIVETTIEVILHT
jgi:hypothetical protein